MRMPILFPAPVVEWANQNSDEISLLSVEEVAVPVTKITLPDLKQLTFAQAERSGQRQCALVLTAGEEIFQLEGHVDCFRELATVIMRDIFGVDTSELDSKEWDDAWKNGGLWRRWLAGDLEAFRRNRDPEEANPDRT